MVKPTASIIIVNWNTSKLLENCLTSVIRGTKIPFEVIVVDNASTDDSASMVSRKFPSVKMIVNTHNLGYGAGNNRGIKIAKGKYIVILNQDTIIPNGALTKLVDWLEMNPHADIVGPQLRFPNGKLQTSGGGFPNLLNVFIHFLGINDIPFLEKFLPLYQQGGMYLSGKGSDTFKKEHQIEWMMGACFVAKKEVFQTIGGFDEKIFMYMEEVEWFYRAHVAGFVSWYTPSVWITHIKGASSSSGLRGPILGEYRGLLHFFGKHKPSWQKSLVRFILKVGAAGRIVLFTILRRPALVSIYQEAIFI